MAGQRGPNPRPGRAERPAPQPALPPAGGIMHPFPAAPPEGGRSRQRRRAGGLLLCNFTAGVLLVLLTGLAAPLLSASPRPDPPAPARAGPHASLLTRLKREHPLDRKSAKRARGAARRAEAGGRRRLAALYRVLLAARGEG